MDPINEARALYGKPPLEVCQECTVAAQDHANRFVWEHSGLDTPHGRVGQNMAMGGKNFTLEKAVATWMEEAQKYYQGMGGYGHFTQLVWKDTTHYGVGISKRGNHTIVVVNFHPPGNVPGQFEENI